MAKRFLTPINIVNLSTDPVVANEGDIYYNTTSDKLRIYVNSAWTDASSGGGVTSLTGTANEIEVSASTGSIQVGFPNEVRIESLNAGTASVDVSYASNIFLALSYLNSELSYSTNGIVWTLTTDRISNQAWNAVTYGNNKFVAVAGYNQASSAAAISTDSITWTAATMPASQYWGSIAYGNNVFVAVPDNSSSIAASSTNGITWTARTLPSAQTWRSVAYGNNVFVAISYFSSLRRAAVSTDAITWTVATLPQSLGSSNKWFDITYGNDVFVAVAGLSSFSSAVSTDAITWTLGTLPSTGWYSVTHGNNKFVAVSGSFGGGSQNTAYSTNGISWTASTLPSASFWWEVAYGNNAFVAIAYNGAAAYSTDAITWTATTLSSTIGWNALTYGTPTISTPKSIAPNLLPDQAGNSGKYLTTDGTTSSWGTIDLSGYQPLDGDLTSIAGLSGSAGLLRKTDLNTFTLDTSTYLTGNETITLSGDAAGSGATSISVTLANSGVSASSYGSASVVPTFTVDAKGRLTAASNTAIAIEQSAVTNLTTDLSQKQPLDSDLTGISDADLNYAGNLYKTSIGSLSAWTTVTSNSSDFLKCVSYGNGLWVAGGASGDIVTSTNGSTWTTVTSNFGAMQAVRSVAYGNGIWVAGSDNGQIRSSTDGITWTTVTSNFGSTWIYSIAYGNNLWVAGGLSGQIRTSTDGSTWATVTSNFGTSYIYTIAYGNGLWIAGGGAGQMRTSTNGSTWTTVTSNFGTTRITTLDYNNNLWVAGGYSGQIRTSTNGSTWTTNTSTFGGDDIQSISYGNGMWVAVGYSLNISTSVETSNYSWLIDTNTYATQSFVSSSYAPLASPTFTGTPTAPTAALGTNTTQIATTQFVNSEISNDAVLLTGSTMTGTLVFPAATTSIPSIRIPHGTAPSAPTNGDIWTTTDGVYARINGATVGPLGTGGGTVSYENDQAVLAQRIFT